MSQVRLLIFCEKLLSLLDHTRERLSHHPKRQARRRGDPRAHQRSYHGVRDLHQEYVKRGANADGEGELNAKCKGQNAMPHG